MGHIYVKATFYNAIDYVQYVEGKRRLEEVRKVEALVDKGAVSQLCLKIGLRGSRCRAWAYARLEQRGCWRS
ncbi:MAG: hypothetical protein QXJ21_04450 [Thermofilum sp.]